MNDAVPDVVGVPDTTPPEDNDNPAGNEPDDTDHTFGVVPSTATMVCEYATPT